jgi:hypothetical protein
MTDTEPQVERKFYEMIMSRSGEERFMMGIRSFEVARTIVLASLPKDLPEHELKQKLFERVYGAPVENFIHSPSEASEDAG